MKVSQLIKVFNELDQDTEVCVLWWERETFDDPDEPVTDECWTNVCNDFDNWDDAGADISEWVANAICDYK